MLSVLSFQSNMLISVPGGSDGPGGVLVCSEDWITYKNQGHPGTLSLAQTHSLVFVVMTGACL